MAETSADPAAGVGSALRLVVNSDLQLLLGCVVCGGTLSEPVLFGGCLHSACRKCFDGLRGTGPASSRDGNAADAGGSSSDGDAAAAGGASTVGDNSSIAGDNSSTGGDNSITAGDSGDSSSSADRGPGSSSTDGSHGGSDDVATAESNAAGGQCTSDTKVSCPACGAAPLQANACGGQKVNIFVAALQRAKAIACGGDAPCDFCPNDKDATPQRADRWCAECNKCICSQCTGWHGKFNKDHAPKALAAPGGSDGGMRCHTCPEDGESRLAARWCPDCANVLCNSCAQWHDRFQRTHRTHPLAAGDVIVNQGLLIAPPCRQHGARSEMYCRSCDGLCCADCAKPCLEASHDVYVVDGARTKEYVERARADLKAAESSLSDRAAALAQPPRSSDDGTSTADGDDDDADKVAAKALQSAMAADRATLSSSRQRAVEAVGRAFDELEERVKSHYATLRRSLLLPDEQQLQQQQSHGTSGVRTAKSLLRDAVGHGLLYSRMLLQMADTSIVLDQHASVLAGLRALLDRADRATNLLPALEQLKPIVQALDAASFDSLLAAHCTRLILPSPGSDEKTVLLSHTSPASTSSASGGAAAAVAASRPEPNDSATARSNVPTGDSAAVDDSEDDDGIGIGDAIRQITTDGNLRDVAITVDGCVLLADSGKGLRQFSSTGKKLATWHASKGVGDRSKAGVVSTVCMLDDGRIAVGIISSGCIVLLRSAPTTGSSGGGEPANDGGRWIEDGQIKLDGGPYHVAARRDALAVALARSDEHKVDLGGVSAVVGSNWGPGPRVDVVSLGPDPRLKYDIGYQVVAVLLTDEAVVVSSDDKVKTGTGGSGRTSYVVDAYERLPPSAGAAAAEGGPGRRLWRYECEEHAHDLCAATATSSVIYVALPHSRRIVAIDGATGTWLVDVFSGGAAAPTASGKPLRLAVARPRRKASGAGSKRPRPLLAVMYNGAAVAVTLHPVGSGGADD